VRPASVLLAGFVALLALEAGCAGPRTPAPAATAADPSAEAAAFDRMEDEILRDLAAIDRRVASREHVVPSEADLRRVAMAAVLGEDVSVALVDGRIDAFSFDARARGLANAAKRAAALPADRQTPSEQRLLSNLVVSEVVRLDEERALPRSASALVRAIVDGWQPPRTDKELAELDRWLTRRLGVIREAVASNDPATGLDVVRARELDDALDALERLTSTIGFRTSMQELVRLRDAVEAAGARPAAKVPSDWSALARRMEAHLGVVVRADELAADLAALEPRLRSAAESAIAAAGTGLDRESLLDELDKQVFASGPCVDAVPSSRVRSMSAPPEREAGCHLRHLVARSTDSRTRAVALAAMHDHVVVAGWALDVARGAATLSRAEEHHLRLLPSPPDSRARYERIATARPVAAIGAGITVKILCAGNDTARAAAWSAVGDVPLDVATELLASIR
jgi:hypothetical protein